MKKGLQKKGLVYLVDNHRLYREMIKIALEPDGYSIRFFEDGSHVLRALSVNKAIPINTPNLIICELEMRMMDGLTLYEETRKLSRCDRPIPFLFITSSTDQELISDAEQRSGSPVFDKRILLEPLKSLVREVLAKPVANCGNGETQSEKELNANPFIL